MTRCFFIFSLVLALTSCQGSSPHDAAPVSEDLSDMSRPANQPMARYVGFWKQTGAELNIIRINAHFDSKRDQVVTTLSGLNLQDEAGYQFVGNSDEDQLEIQVNEKGTVESVAKKTVNQKPTLIEMTYQLSSTDSLNLQVQIDGRFYTKSFVRVLDPREGYQLYANDQKEKVKRVLWPVFQTSDPRRCDMVGLEYMPQRFAENHDRVCLERQAREKPDTLKNPAVLDAAIKVDDSEMVKLLIEHGVSIEERNPDDNLPAPLTRATSSGWTAYRLGDHGLVSSRFEHNDIVKMLLRGGASFAVPSGFSSDRTVFEDLLLTADDPEIVDIMLRRGARFNGRASEYGSGFIGFFYRCSERWGRDAARLLTGLLDAGGDSNEMYSDHSGGVLSRAITDADVDVLKILHERGARFNEVVDGKRFANQVIQEKIAELRNSLNDKANSPWQIQVEIKQNIQRLDRNLEYVNTLKH